jgi:hypothetical protein
MEKEAGIAEDVAWHEMELLPNLTYTWKGKGVTRPVSCAMRNQRCCLMLLSSAAVCPKATLIAAH